MIETRGGSEDFGELNDILLGGSRLPPQSDGTHLSASLSPEFVLCGFGLK